MSPRGSAATHDREPSGVSLDPEDFVATALGLGPGPAIGEDFIFDWFDFKKRGERKAILRPCLIVKWVRDDESEEIPYGTGDGWDISKDGMYLIPKKGQTGLNQRCGAAKLIASLGRKGCPKGFVTTPDRLNGIEVELEQEALPKGEEGGRSLLLVADIISAPWDKDFGKKGGKRKKAEEAPAPTRRGRAPVEEEEPEPERPRSRRGAAVVEDEEPEPAAPPARRGRGRAAEAEEEAPAAAPARGRGRQAATPAADAEDLDTEAIEAIITTLEAMDGPIKVKDFEDELLATLKGNKQAKAIAAVAVDPEFLDTEKGWTFDGKTISLPDAKPAARARR